MRLFLLGIGCVFHFATFAQSSPEEMAERHAQISTSYQDEKYAEVIELVDQQFSEAAGTMWQDSIYQYCYNYGRAKWKVDGADAGAKAAELICTFVEEKDGDPSHLVSALGDLSWLLYELGRMDECVRVDSTAMVAADHVNPPDYELRGKMRHYVGFDYAVLGDHTSAARFFLDAIDNYLKADSPPRMNLSESCNGVGSSYWHLGRNKEAEQYYLRSLEWLGDSKDLDMINRKGSALGNLSILWEDAGDLTKAKEYAYQNLEIRNQILEETTDPMIRDEAIMTRSLTYANLAELYNSLGEYGISRDLLDRAYADRSTVLEPDDPKLLSLKEMYASLEQTAGNHQRAEELVDEFLEAAIRVYGPISEYSTRALNQKAGIVAATGDFERAETLYDRSIRDQLQLVQVESDPILANMYRDRAACYEALGRYTDAMTDLQKAKEIYSVAQGEGSHRVVSCLIDMAEVRFAQGQLNAADRLSEEALGLLAKRRSLDDDTVLPSTDVGPHLLASAIYNKVNAQRALGIGTSRSHLKELREAIRSLDRNRLVLRDEESRLLLLGSQQRTFQLGQAVAYDLYKQDGSDEWKTELLSLMEENRSILLKNRLNAFSSLSFSGVPDSVLDLEVQLTRGLSDSQGENSAQQLIKREEDFEEFIEDLEQEYPEYFELKYGTSRLSIEEVQDVLLMEGQTLIAYSMADTMLFVIVMNKDESHVLRLPGDGVDELVLEFNEALTAGTESPYFNLGHELYQRVFEPLTGMLRNTELLIVPDQELHYLNFEALLGKPSSKENFSDHFLIHDYTISYLLSATTAVQFKRLEHDRADGALAVVPGFSDELKNDYLKAHQDSSSLDTAFLKYIQQPFATSTASSMQGLLSAKVMLGHDAHEANFKQEAERHGIIHLGTHTEVNNTSPLYSKLVLSKDAEEDGYLHAYEIYAMELRAELAVLTACETGTGKQYSSEGVRSLAHSFAYAGCPSLVMSLWKIDEQSSSEIITAFYEELADSQAKNHALRAAKLEFLAQAGQEQRLPYYWAGMVLVGDTSPVADISPYPWYKILALGGFLLIMVILVWQRTRKNKPR